MMFGIYTAAHGTTCQGRPGSYLYEEIDSSTYCDIGIDYLKASDSDTAPISDLR